MKHTLREHLARALAAHPAAPLAVAFSGGHDSTALLDALADLPPARARGLRALHVDHHLQAASTDWARQALAFCTARGIPCALLDVEVDLSAGLGLEAAARQARHAALAAALQPGECLLFAHHRDDQVETVLLKLLRGAGPEGLAGMRAERAFGPGTLWRPLLDLSRAALAAHLAARGIAGIDDPSNADTRLARNHLRHVVLPQLAAHWPQAADAILASAAACRAAADSLRTRWLAAFATLYDEASASLDAAGWLALEPALREPLLDHWLHRRALDAPSRAQRREILRQAGARDGRVPCISWGRTEVRLWKGRLWALPAGRAIDPAWRATWCGEPLPLPDGGELALEPRTARLAQALDVRLRRGGERLRLDGETLTRELRDLFQQGAIPPWRRAACPLLYAGETLVGVGERWLGTTGAAVLDRAGARLRWTPGR